MKITNKHGIPLALAVWLLHDEYDYIKEKNYFSVTGLLKPTRHLIIPPRIDTTDLEIDLESMTARALGHAIHDSIEKAWKKDHRLPLKRMGYPENQIDRVLINPTDAEVAMSNNPIPVYLEQRMYRKLTVDGVVYIIGGKFDMITDGRVNDTKSTSAWSWAGAGRDDDHIDQLSTYNWIDKDAFSDLECETPIKPRITDDTGQINYVFTDWQKNFAKTVKGYPDVRVKSKDLPLKSAEEVEARLTAKIRELRKFWDAPETVLPRCTEAELWMSDPKYKYFSDPNKTNGRATKNFDSLIEARTHAAQKGKGVVLPQPREAKRCAYCPAFEGCTQKDEYL